MKNKDNNIYIQHVLYSIEKIETWVSGTSFENFADDKELLQSSVIRQLGV